MLSEKTGTNKHWACAQTAHRRDVIKTSHVLRESADAYTPPLSRV
jgi:hypothetical protein